MPKENVFDNYQKLQDKQQLSQGKQEETHFVRQKFKKPNISDYDLRSRNLRHFLRRDWLIKSRLQGEIASCLIGQTIIQENFRKEKKKQTSKKTTTTKTEKKRQHETWFKMSRWCPILISADWSRMKNIEGKRIYNNLDLEM